MSRTPTPLTRLAVAEGLGTGILVAAELSELADSAEGCRSSKLDLAKEDS